MSSQSDGRARRVAIVGVPFNSSGTSDGVARAPAALREAGLVEALTGAGLDVDDRGDIPVGPTSPTRDPGSHVIAPDALTSMIRMVRDEVDAIIRDGQFPLVLGGDCPVLLGCIAAPAVGAAGVLFVDGHEDAWPPEASTTGEAADMELALALGLATAGLPGRLLEVLPRLDPDRVIAIGPRDQAEIADAGVASIEGLVEMIRPEAVHADTAEALGADCIDRLGVANRTWFHVDLDVLATTSLAAIDYPLPGGFDWPTLTALSRGALSHPSVAGWDVTIYNPDLDPTGSDAKRIARYVVDVLRD